MKKWKYHLYRALLGLAPARGRVNACRGLDEALARDIAGILRRNHAVGATLALFDTAGVTGVLAYGLARRGAPALPAREDTVYRTASIAKLVTALAAFRLDEACRVDLNADVDAFLPCSLRHPGAQATPITLRMLMSHTAGIHDGRAYAAAKLSPAPLSALMQGDSHTAHLPGRGFEYSNLGAGIAACALEGMLDMPFERIMQDTRFAPLGVTATFYPQKARGVLADNYRVLPPRKAPALDARAWQARPLPAQAVDREKHYLLSQGNLWITAPMLARLGAELLRARYAPMRREIAPFGARDGRLSEGLGTFILRVPGRARPVYGHQGLAYGAAHGLFFDPESGRGFVLLTSGCSEARLGVMADINLDLIRRVLA